MKYASGRAAHIPMIVWGGKHDVLEWLVPGILIVGVFLALPIVAVLVNMAGQIIVLPFLAVFGLAEHIKKKRKGTGRPTKSTLSSEGAPSDER